MIFLEKLVVVTTSSLHCFIQCVAVILIYMGAAASGHSCTRSKHSQNSPGRCTQLQRVFGRYRVVAGSFLDSV